MKTVFNRNSTQPDGLGGSRALINPWDVLKPVPGFPQTCVSTFSAKIIQCFAAMDRGHSGIIYCQWSQSGV